VSLLWHPAITLGFHMAVAVVATSGERHEGKAGVVVFAGKTV